MDYTALINETKKKIDNYTFDDSQYNAIYEAAKEKLTEAYKAGENNINLSLDSEKQQAAGENALATKSLQEALATRGLARSGESSMLKLNQQLSLSNALAKLSSAALQSKNELYAQHQKELAELAADIGQQKATAIENEKSLLYGRLSDLEKLNAEDEERKANLYAASSSSGGGSGGTYKTDDTSGFNPNEALQGFAKKLTNSDGNTPTMKPEKLAEQIMLNCGVDDGKIRSGNMQNRIYRELVKLAVSSDYSKEYTKEVVDVLRTYGFSIDFDMALVRGEKIKQIYYAYQSNFNSYYTALIRSGFDANAATTRARERAKKYANDYLKALNLSEDEYNKLLNVLWFL